MDKLERKTLMEMTHQILKDKLMQINRKRVINIDNIISHLRENEEFYISVKDIESKKDELIKLDLLDKLEVGNKFLPKAIGSISRYNSNGKYIVHRDRQKVPYTFERYWERLDYQKNTVGTYCYITKLRYPRTDIEAPNCELIVTNIEGEKAFISTLLTKNDKNKDYIKHYINLFLEIFGECEIIREDLTSFMPKNVKRLNWKILPIGNKPWKDNNIREVLSKTIESNERGNNRKVILRSMDKIGANNPSWTGIGIGGFNDYVIFGFDNKGIYILESFKNGNATYVFDKNWKELSKLSKAEILNNNLQVDRVIHTPEWETKINNLLK